MAFILPMCALLDRCRQHATTHSGASGMLMCPAWVFRTESCCRCTDEDVADAIKLPRDLPADATAWHAQANRQDALRQALLKDCVELNEKYAIKGTESEGHKAARRNEQLLQLLLCLHVLAAEAPGVRC